MYEKLKKADQLVETKAEFLELIENFIEGEEEGQDCVAVYFQLPGLVENEIIINPKVNINKKLDYYGAAYNDDLELHNNKEVKIVGVSFL